jgi:hypothetical protein
MDTSRQLYATISLLTTFVTCMAWWFAYSRCRRQGIFLMLAVIHTVALVFAVDNLHLAFTERTFIRFSSSHAQMTYFTVLSYLQAAMWIVEAIASLLLVRWIVQRFGRTSNAA